MEMTYQHNSSIGVTIDNYGRLIMHFFLVRHKPTLETLLLKYWQEYLQTRKKKVLVNIDNTSMVFQIQRNFMDVKTEQKCNPTNAFFQLVC